MLQDAESLYQHVVLDRSQRPRYALPIADPDGMASCSNRLCGDQVSVTLRVSDGRISAVAANARGCAISVAAADLMAEIAHGLGPTELHGIAARFAAMLHRTVDLGTLPEMLRPLSGLCDYPSRIGCATLPWDALLAALEGAERGRDHGG